MVLTSQACAGSSSASTNDLATSSAASSGHAVPDKVIAAPAQGPPRVALYEGGTKVTNVGGKWKKYIHINGGVYFFNPDLKLITEDDMEDEETRQLVLQLRREFLKTLYEDDLLHHIPPDAELIIRLGNDEANEQAMFVSHSQQKYVGCMDTHVEIETSTSQYWTHLEEYPMHLTRLPPCACADFLSALAYGANEAVMDNRKSKFPFTDAQVERLLRIYDDLFETAQTNANTTPILIWHIARTMRRIEGARMWYHVQHRSIPGFCGFKLEYTRKAVMKAESLRLAKGLLLLVFFRTHAMYWRRLEQSREGGSVDLLGFRSMLAKFLVEWSDSNLLATVLVGANVTLLSLPTITSLQRTAALTSAIFAVMSIVVGLYHVWHHRTKVNAGIIEACKYMSHTRHYDDRTDDTADLLIMAAFLAIPIAALLWSILCFAIAISAYCVQSTDRVGGTVLPIIIGISTFVGGFTVFLFARSCKVRAGIGGGSQGVSAALDGPASFAGGV